MAPDWMAPAMALSGWRPRSDRGSLGGITTSPNPYRGFRFPAKVVGVVYAA